MFLAHVLLAVCICLCGAKIKYVKPTTSTAAVLEEDATMPNPLEEEEDIEQKIALIDIVFVDGTKRTCTGAIIHDNVVITAGHCFMGSDANMPYKRPELTASFVVIGTQKKFESGYEQYLPIERVVTHPNLRGWNSDLALVHTFASMTADKIGAIMHLASEQNVMHMEANLTIYSWGRAEDGTPFLDHGTRPPPEEESDWSGACGESDDKYNFNGDRLREHYFGGYKACRNGGDKKSKEHISEHKKVQQLKSMNSVTSLSNSVVRLLQYRTTPQWMSDSYQLPNLQTSKVQNSRYLSSVEKNHGMRPSLHRFHKIERNTRMAYNVINNTAIDMAAVSKMLRESAAKASAVKNNPDSSKNPLTGLRKLTKSRRSKSGVRSWRRHLGATEVNKLSVESFGMVNSGACKKIIDKVAPEIEISMEHIMCYASDDRYVTDADSGALAVRLGELVGITVGGIESEGTHVAIGLRISQFCPWIAENLPAGDFLNCWITKGNVFEVIRDYDVPAEEQPPPNFQTVSPTNVKIFHHRNRYLEFLG